MSIQNTVRTKQQQKGPPAMKLTTEQEKDLKITLILTQKLLYNGGFDQIQAAMQTKDPGQVIGHFLVVMWHKLYVALTAKMSIDASIVLCHGGWLEQVSDFIQKKIKVPKQVMDRAEIYMAHTALQLAAAQKAGQQQAAQGTPAPVTPPQGGPGGAPTPGPAQPPQGGPPMLPQGGQ